MSIHAMIDLETLSTKQNAVILSIGAVKFDPAAKSGFSDEFHVGIDPGSYGNLIGGGPLGFDISADTVMWWLDPARAEARVALAGLEKVDLATALEGFAMWYKGEPVDASGTLEDKPSHVWSNGATFDITILKRTYELVGLPCPWGFRAENCYRTIYNMLGFMTPKPGHQGTAHDALSDAKWQADKLRMMLEAVDPTFARF